MKTERKMIMKLLLTLLILLPITVGGVENKIASIPTESSFNAILAKDWKEADKKQAIANLNEKSDALILHARDLLERQDIQALIGLIETVKLENGELERPIEIALYLEARESVEATKALMRYLTENTGDNPTKWAVTRVLLAVFPQPDWAGEIVGDEKLAQKAMSQLGIMTVTGNKMNQLHVHKYLKVFNKSEDYVRIWENVHKKKKMQRESAEAASRRN